MASQAQNPVSNTGFKPVAELTEKPKRKTRKKKSDVPTFIEGWILLMIIDIVLPMGISTVFNMFVKNKPHLKIEASELSLQPDQQAKLEPLAEQAANHLKVNVNPVAMFFIMSTIMYTQNLFTLQAFKKQ